MQSLAERAQILVEALPYLRQYAGATIVIKYGGSAMTDPGLKASVLRDVVLLRYVGMQPVVVHGGGPEISQVMSRMGLEARFVSGLRVTDEAAMEVAEMVLAGKTNSDLVATINGQGGRAVGLSGKDADLLRARKRTESGVDLGLVGEVERVNTEIIHTLINAGFLPVIAPVGVGENGETYNLNADHVAGAVAAALDADKLIMLTDVTGVFENKDDPSSLITELRASRARALIESGRIDAGMVPKVEACLRAVEGGTVRAHIIDGSLPHALIMEIFTDRGIGTMVTRE